MAESPESQSDGVLKLTLSCNGSTAAESTQIVSVEVVRAVNRVPYARIVILDGDMPEQDFPVSNSDDFAPGSEIKVSAGYGSDEDAIFEGVVIKHSIAVTGNNYSRLILECRDKAVAMTVGRKNANYVDKKDSDIITTLIGNSSGLTADVEATTVEYKELVQYYCTDWDFMLSRAEANGLLVTVEDGKVSVKAPDVSSAAELSVTYGQDLLEFHADLDARMQFASVKGVSWDIQNQKAIESEVTPQTLNAQGNLQSSDLAKVINLSSFRLQTPVAIDSSALKAWATGQQIKSGLSRIRGSMKFQGSAKAKVGSLIELAGVGDRFNGNVFVSSVRHSIESGDWVSEVEFGMSPDWFAEQRDLVAPSVAGLLPGVDGLQIGVVKKLDADPEGHYRVRVSVPVLQAETEGVWARLANFHGSNGFGAFFIPEIGDEVVLGYINNDPGSPVILGSLYSSKQKAPYELAAENNTKAIVTREKLKVEFDEEKKVITIVTPGNNTIVISDDGKSILLQDQNSNKVELNDSGITMDSPKDINIKATGKITMEATGEIGITSQADVKVTGLNVTNTANVGFTAKGNATAEISASGQTTVKGAMVMIN